MESLKTTPSSTTIRFLGILKQPDSIANPLELTESDVVWSSDLSESTTDPLNSPPLSTTSNSPTNHSFRPSKYGLSAALSDDHPPLLQRKPSLSAASAARAIRAVPTHRSSSSFEELSGSGSGRYMQSAPVNIPVWPKWKESENRRLDRFSDDDGENELEEKMVMPPHEIVARSQTTAFSVFEGVGRTLKGRDLRRVRNAVFQKTDDWQGLGSFKRIPRSMLGYSYPRTVAVRD